ATASTLYLPTTRIATLIATARADIIVRIGRRVISRSTIFNVGERYRPSPRDSNQDLLKRPGDAGRRASAGGSFSTCTSDSAAPVLEANKPTTTAKRMVPGRTSYCSIGKRKNPVYMAVIALPSHAPKAIPSTTPNAPIIHAKLR